MEVPILSEKDLKAILEKIGHENFADILSGRTVVSIHKLISLVGLVDVPAVKNFVLKYELEAANVGKSNQKFDRIFMDKKESNISARRLKRYHLEKELSSDHIYSILDEKPEISLAHLFSLIDLQREDQEKGPLLVDGSANVIFTLDSKGKLWTVRAQWSTGHKCWRCETRSIESSRGWFVGSQFFS